MTELLHHHPDETIEVHPLSACSPEHCGQQPGYWKKGDKDPDAGTPNRHTRSKAMIMLVCATDQQVRRAMLLLLEKRAGDVLDALIAQEEE